MKNEPMKKTSRGRSHPLFALFLCLALTLGVYTLLRPGKTYSETENRMLAAFPKTGLSGFWDGETPSGLERWFSDRFAGREWWRQVFLSVKKGAGIRENGGVLLGDERLYLITEPVNEARLSRTLSGVGGFLNEHPDLNAFVCVVPNALCIYKDELPNGYAAPDQGALLNRIADALPGATFVNVTPALENARHDDIFYRTDHHWTSVGAKAAFEEVKKAMGLEDLVSGYDVKLAADDFEGTLSSKSADRTFRDTLELWLPKTDVLYVVTYLDSMEKTASLYVPEALNAKDKYTVFFGGNHPRLDFTTTAETGRRLLVFKDSYFNAFAQFLWPYFEKIVVVDPRYDSEDVSAVVEREGITDVLFLYNADTFASDESLARLLSP